MSTTIDAVRVETQLSAQRQRPWVVGAVMAGAVMALMLAGLVDLSKTSSATWTCVPRVGCEQVENSGTVGLASIESSFAVADAQASSATWIESMIGPTSPALRHFLHPAEVGPPEFEPVSPALEHFLHPAP